MDINAHLTDEQHVEVAKLEYEDLAVGAGVKLSNGAILGRVSRIFYENDGLRGTMITKKHRHYQEITILFRGSAGLRNGNPTTWSNEWLATNLPVGRAIVKRQVGDVPSQLRSAAKILNNVMTSKPTAHFYVYGHSLGSINAQYALANCASPNRLYRAFLYEGPNIYWLLDAQQKSYVKKLRYKINNYVDPFDIVTLGYTDLNHAIGQVHDVQSDLLDPITQHMWGGYQFDQNGKLATKPLIATRERIDDRLINELTHANEIWQTWRQAQLAESQKLIDKLENDEKGILN